MLWGGPYFSPFSILLRCPPTPSFLPCGRSKLLRWNNDHPSRNRCEGGRLHHLPLPQRGLVEAGAVCPAGVPQWPDAGLGGHRRGWRESSADALYHWQGRNTVPKQPEMDEDLRTLKRKTLNLNGWTCLQVLPPVFRICLTCSAHTQVSTRRPRLRPVTTKAHLYFLYVHPLSACCGHLSQKKSEL